MRERKILLAVFAVMLALALPIIAIEATPALTATRTSTTPTATTSENGQNQSSQQQSSTDYQTYTNSPDSVIQLLKDSEAAVKAASDNGMGVHIYEKSYFSIEGEATIFESEGDIMLPDRAKLTAEIHLPKREQPYGWDGGPLTVQAIQIGSTLYLKPSFSNTWSVFQIEKESDPVVSDVDLEAINFYDYIKSSSNLGLETMPNGNKAYHVEIEIDTPKLIEKIKSVMKPDKVEKYGSDLDKMKSSVVTSDTWIGADNLLVYQAFYKIDNVDLQLSCDDAFRLSNWGEVVDISPPVDAVPVSGASAGSSSV